MFLGDARFSSGIEKLKLFDNGNLRFVACLRRNSMKKSTGTVILFCISLFFFLISTGACESPADSPEPYRLHFTPGTYTESSQGYMLPVSVTVTFSEDTITGITIDEGHGQSTDRSEVTDALEHIPRLIQEGQTLLVDKVSGATFTSRAITGAVEKCVRQAGGDEAVAKLKESGTAKAIAGYLGH
jgi:uncharacterized protein with FMN-binding domain